jgi:hypothetical protein
MQHKVVAPLLPAEIKSYVSFVNTGLMFAAKDVKVR